MTTRILFVCLGNICRSPTAEAVFATKSAGLDVEIDSAGTAGYHIGAPPYEAMQQAAKARGYDMAHLRARQVRDDDFDRFDLIVAMDAENLSNLERMRNGRTTPVRLFTDYADGSDAFVPDPYYTRDFEGALDLIERCADGLSEVLRTGKQARA